MFIRNPNVNRQLENIDNFDFKEIEDSNLLGTDRFIPPPFNSFPPPPSPGPNQPPGPPIGPTNPSGSGEPPGPPPKVTPKKSTNTPSVKSVSPGSIRPCVFQYVYIWLDNGRSFWAWLTRVDRRTASGFRWTGFMWVYFGVDLRRIEFFQCFGRNNIRTTNSISDNIRTNRLAPSTFKMEYPYIDGLSNEVIQSDMNEDIIGTLNSLFLSQVILPEKTDLKEIISSYQIPLDEKGLLSIVFSLYTYSGGAHGNTVFDSITFNTDTGEPYDFDELFNPKLNYTEALNKIIMTKVKENNIPVSNEFSGVTDNQKFYLTPQGLVLYYQIYEFTPYSYGLFRILIPYSELKDLIYPLSPLAKFMNKN